MIDGAIDRTAVDPYQALDRVAPVVGEVGNRRVRRPGRGVAYRRIRHEAGVGSGDRERAARALLCGGLVVVGIGGRRIALRIEGIRVKAACPGRRGRGRRGTAGVADDGYRLRDHGCADPRL